MTKRFVAIWFRYLKTDWYIRRIPGLAKTAFVLSLPDHGRMVVTAINAIAQQRGIYAGMSVADARAIFPALHVLDDKPGHADTILKGLADWCIRYTPCVAVDMPEGLVLDATGCAHLWGGEKNYLQDITMRLQHLGYQVRVSMAGTIGAAWALSRFGEPLAIIEPGGEKDALSPLPAAALRLQAATLERLQKLGLRQVGDFMEMPPSALRRRFGEAMLQRLDQALGTEEEHLQPVVPVEDHQVRLPCMEPILTRAGIEIALQTLLENLCARLKTEGKGLRTAVFKCFRVDGKIMSIDIGTSRATTNVTHLFKLFETKLDTIEPALGIELFLLEASKTDDVSPVQKNIWEKNAGLQNTALFELLDRLGGKFGMHRLHRYLPDEHYWPERSIKPATSLSEQLTTAWKVERPRPQQLLARPEPIQVTAPIPDYPPMLFRYKGKLHTVKKADGPERIEQEWWLQEGQHRDYYTVEDEEGNRYWLFRLGHYDADKTPGWFLHGFFA
jgi:protein ImuB